MVTLARRHCRMGWIAAASVVVALEFDEIVDSEANQVLISRDDAEGEMVLFLASREMQHGPISAGFGQRLPS
jgi:hypothetical protein